VIDPDLVDAAFSLHRAIARAPQMAWGVLIDGALVHSGGHDADAHTAFRIASMTKSFTAAAVLALRDDGAFALDDPVARHAPELAALRAPWRDAPPVTIRHLLTMSSGLATDDPWADRHLDLSDVQLDAVIESGGTWAAAPGTVFEYSNLGYGLLGRIVMHVSGTRVQDVVRARLLDPLGMHETAWTAGALPDGTRVAAGFARVASSGSSPPMSKDESYVEEPMVRDGTIAPMGGLFTTVADLATWVAFLADAFPPRDDLDEAPLTRASRREMQRVWTAIEPERSRSTDGRARPGALGYGMGILVQHHELLGPVLGHSGGLPGFGSNMRWAPAAGVGLIALANVTYAPMTDTTMGVLEVLAQQRAVTRRPLAVSDALADAAERLVGLLEVWDDARAEALFTDNVLADESVERRRAAAARAADEHGGGFVIERIDAETATRGTAHVRGARSSFEVELMLAPLVPARVQWYELRSGS
jgi:CubicO group peptidase (beta-lactamase class C family)